MNFGLQLLLGLLFFLTACNQKHESICLIPKGYTGVVLIIYGQKQGVVPRIENGKRVYRIPPTGVLRTQAEPNNIVAEQEYFYIDSIDNRTPLSYNLPKGWEDVQRKINADIVYCFNEEMGETAFNKPGFKKYRAFLVGRFSQVDSLSNIKNRILFKELTSQN